MLCEQPGAERRCRFSIAANKQNFESWDWLVSLTDLHNRGRRLYWSRAVNKCMLRVWVEAEIWNLQLVGLSKSGPKWVQIWKKMMLFESPIKSNCACKAREVFFVFKLNACGSRNMPSVQIWALLFFNFFLWTEHHHEVTFTLWNFNETGRQIKIDEESLSFYLQLGAEASPPTSGPLPWIHFGSYKISIRYTNIWAERGEQEDLYAVFSGFIWFLQLRQKCQALSMTMNETCDAATAKPAFTRVSLWPT